MIVPCFFLIEQTNYCQLRCPCCPHRLQQRPQGYMQCEMFRRIVDDIAAHVPDGLNVRIALHGYGEPLLSPDLWRNLDYLEQCGFRNVDFSTNGMALGAEQRERLAKYRCLSWIRVSINSSRPKLMEEINAGSNFERVAGNFRAMREANPHARVVTQLMRTRKNEDETVEEFKGVLGDVPVIAKTLDTLGNGVDAEGLAYPSQVQSGCVFANNSFFVHWDGDIVGCCIDDTKSQVIGNARDGMFSPMVQTRLAQMRERLAARDFDALPFCGSCYGCENNV